MVRPAVGASPRRCAECGGCEYGGAPACTACREVVDGIVDEEWSVFPREWDDGRHQEAVLAEMVASAPDRHDWRVVDAAFDRLVCPDRGDGLGRGPFRSTLTIAGHPPADRARGPRPWRAAGRRRAGTPG